MLALTLGRNMKFLPQNLRCRLLYSDCSRRALIALLILVVGSAHFRAQVQASAKPAAPPANKIAAIKSFRIVQEKEGQAVEILSTKPVVPSIQAIGGPDRLVIDLPNARLETKQKRISVQADQISTLRADQFQQNPPVARVVVDLLAPRQYRWEAAGNRLVVHLGKNPAEARNASPFEPLAVASMAPGPKPVVMEVRAAGPLALAENDGGSGSSITAGRETAVLKLSSGGRVHVCPGTTVAITPSENRHNVMLSMNTGALEAHFALDASSDSVMTPDFRILLAGPGEFHYAFSADNQGNTCVRALPGNTSAAIVSELLGNRTYQVKATEQIVFRSGQLDRVDMKVPLECGCPPSDAPLRAIHDLPIHDLPMQTREVDEAPPVVNSNPAAAEISRVDTLPSAGMPKASIEPMSTPNEIHVEVSAPFVFNPTGPAPAPVEDVRAMPFDARPYAAMPLDDPIAPAAGKKGKAGGKDKAPVKRTSSRGFFKKIGGFFAGLFH
jgi:hypothetical protein